MKKTLSLKEFLDQKVDQYNRPSFINDDPVSVPRLFSKKQDIEIAGFFAAIFAWGNRATIIQKAKELMGLMDMQPHAFCLHHDRKGLQRLTGFRHRTFNTTDLLYFVAFLKFHYGRHDSLESAFFPEPQIPVGGAAKKPDLAVQTALTRFHHYFFFVG